VKGLGWRPGRLLQAARKRAAKERRTLVFSILPILRALYESPRLEALPCSWTDFLGTASVNLASRVLPPRGFQRYDKGMRIQEFLKTLRQALRLTGDMEADLAQLGQVLRQDPVLKAGFEALGPPGWPGVPAWWIGGPRGYWAALLLEAAQRLRKARGWGLLWEAPWGKRLRFDRSYPGTTSRTLEEATRFLEALLLSGELRRERPSREEPGEEWAHRHQAVSLPGGLNFLLEVAEEAGLTNRYRPRGVVRREMEGAAALLEMGEGKEYLAALWRRVTREKVPALRAGYLRRPLPAGKVAKGGETVERRRGVVPLVRALALGGYPLPLWERDEEGFRWVLPEAPGELEAKAIARGHPPRPPGTERPQDRLRVG
jgi:hypothetical protein